MTGATTSSPRRARARRGEGEKLRREILDAAERILRNTDDASAVSIRAVADAVGVTPPSIYLHFADKNELLWEVCQQHFEHLDRHVRDAMKRSGASDPVTALLTLGRAYVDFGINNPEHYRILFMSKPDDQPPTFDMEHLRTTGFGQLLDAVSAAMDGGVLPKGNPMPVAVKMWAGVHGLTSLLISKPDFPWPDRAHLVDDHLTMLLRGAGLPT
jgi:AcrR family transcriptional regulator